MLSPSRVAFGNAARGRTGLHPALQGVVGLDGFLTALTLAAPKHVAVHVSAKLFDDGQLTLDNAIPVSLPRHVSLLVFTWWLGYTLTTELCKYLLLVTGEKVTI
jgi:hypothetical protein